MPHLPSVPFSTDPASFGTPPLGRDARDWLSRIGQVRRELDSLRDPCERSFVTVGDALAAAHRTARTLGESAAVLTDTFNAPWLASDATRLEGDLRALDQSLASANNDAGLQGIDEAAAAIGGSVLALGKLLVQVRMLAMNARIEAAQLSGLGMDFTVFTREIGRLADRGEQSIGVINGTLRTLRDILGRAIALQGAMGQQHRDDLAAIIERLRASVATLHQRRDEARTTLGGLPQQLDRARHAVSEVVSALQIADMTRQRVEHVEEALRSVEAALTQSADDAAMGDERRRILVNALCELQSHQLTGIRDDFNEKARVIATNLRALGEGVHGLRDGVTHLHASGSGEGGGVLADLGGDLQRAHNILDRYRGARLETEESMAKVVAMTSDIADAVAAINEIDAEMHLIGLNASIKCGNLGGRGRVLTVIASELQAFARQTRALALEIGTRLDRISRASSALATRQSADDQALVASLDDGIRRFLDNLQATTSQTSAQLGDVSTQADALAQSLETTLATFVIRERMESVFSAAARDLAAVATACRPALTGPALDTARREVLAFLHEHYTMLDEREVHDALFGNEGGGSRKGTPPSAQRQKTGEPDISDLLF